MGGTMPAAAPSPLAICWLCVENCSGPTCMGGTPCTGAATSPHTAAASSPCNLASSTMSISGSPPKMLFPISVGGSSSCMPGMLPRVAVPVPAASLQDKTPAPTDQALGRFTPALRANTQSFFDNPLLRLPFVAALRVRALVLVNHTHTFYHSHTCPVERESGTTLRMLYDFI